MEIKSQKKKKKPIEDALAELKSAHESKDITLIDPAMEKLNTAFQAASQDMYNATQGAEGGNPNEPGAETKKEEVKNDEEVTDVDFEEV
jgi:molecular chaperone DnaK